MVKVAPVLFTKSSACPRLSRAPTPMSVNLSVLSRANWSRPGASRRQVGQWGAQNHRTMGRSDGAKLARFTVAPVATFTICTEGKSDGGTGVGSGVGSGVGAGVGRGVGGGAGSGVGAGVGRGVAGVGAGVARGGRLRSRSGGGSGSGGWRRSRSRLGGGRWLTGSAGWPCISRLRRWSFVWLGRVGGSFHAVLVGTRHRGRRGRRRLCGRGLGGRAFGGCRVLSRFGAGGSWGGRVRHFDAVGARRFRTPAGDRDQAQCQREPQGRGKPPGPVAVPERPSSHPPDVTGVAA